MSVLLISGLTSEPVPAPGPYQCRVEVIRAPLVSDEYRSHDSMRTPLSDRKALR